MFFLKYAKRIFQSVKNTVKQVQFKKRLFLYIRYTDKRAFLLLLYQSHTTYSKRAITASEFHTTQTQQKYLLILLSAQFQG